MKSFVKTLCLGLFNSQKKTVAFKQGVKKCVLNIFKSPKFSKRHVSHLQGLVEGGMLGIFIILYYLCLVREHLQLVNDCLAEANAGQLFEALSSPVLGITQLKKDNAGAYLDTLTQRRTEDGVSATERCNMCVRGLMVFSAVSPRIIVGEANQYHLLISKFIDSRQCLSES